MPRIIQVIFLFKFVEYEDLVRTAQLGMDKKDMSFLKKLNDSQRNQDLPKIFSTENTQKSHTNFEIMIREEAITKHQKVVESNLSLIPL